MIEQTEQTQVIIFSPTEGFWNDDDGWSGEPDGATTYIDVTPGDKATFIDIEAFYVDIKKCIALDWDEAISEVFNSFAQYKGEKIADILNELLGMSLIYEGDSMWLNTTGDDERTFDPEMLQSCMEHDIEDEKSLLGLLNTHCDGTWYEDKLSSGFFSADQ